MSQSDSTGDYFCLSPFHSSRLHRGARGRLEQVPWLKQRPCPSLVNTQFRGGGRTRSMYSAKRVMWEMAGPPDAIHQWSPGESYSCAFLFNSIFIKPSAAETPWLLTSNVCPMSGHFGNEKYVEISVNTCCHEPCFFFSQTRGALLLAAIPRVGSKAGELFFCGLKTFCLRGLFSSTWAVRRNRYLTSHRDVYALGVVGVAWVLQQRDEPMRCRSQLLVSNRSSEPKKSLCDPLFDVQIEEVSFKGKESRTKITI